MAICGATILRKTSSLIYTKNPFRSEKAHFFGLFLHLTKEAIVTDQNDLSEPGEFVRIAHV